MVHSCIVLWALPHIVQCHTFQFCSLVLLFLYFIVFQVTSIPIVVFFIVISFGSFLVFLFLITILIPWYTFLSCSPLSLSLCYMPLPSSLLSSSLSYVSVPFSCSCPTLPFSLPHSCIFQFPSFVSPTHCLSGHFHFHCRLLHCHIFQFRSLDSCLSGHLIIQTLMDCEESKLIARFNLNLKAYKALKLVLIHIQTLRTRFSNAVDNNMLCPRDPWAFYKHGPHICGHSLS